MKFITSYKSYTWLTLFSVLVVLPSLILHADDDDGPDFVSNEIVIKLDPVAGATIEQVHLDYGTTTLSTVLEGAGIYLISVPDGIDPEALSETLEDDVRFLYAEPNYITSTPESGGHLMWVWAKSGGQPVPGAFPSEIIQQAPVQSLELPTVHAESTGMGTIVAVIDTGVDFDHPNLADNLLDTGYDFVDDDPVPQDRRMNLDTDADGKLDENFGHGTHVAGTVLLAAPDAKILPIRVLDSEGQGNIFTLAESIDYAVSAGAHVINLSLGMEVNSDLLEEATERAGDENVLIVAAAGNSNTDVLRYPAADEDVLGVASVDANDIKSNFTNWGSWIGVSAPGEAIISAFPDDSYAEWSGSSMAAPLVAGQAALLKSMIPGLSDEHLIEVITLTALNIDGLNPGWQQKLGAGRIDILASTQTALNSQSDVPLSEAIARLEKGWNESYLIVAGTAIAPINDGKYRFAIGETEVILDLWKDDVDLPSGELIRVAGELELADNVGQAAGFVYELDAIWIEDFPGNRLDDDDDSELTKTYGNRTVGTLAELVDLLNLGQDNDMNVRTTGTLGGFAGMFTDDDDYLFSDDSGVTVMLDLDSRADLDFAFDEGLTLEVIGELHAVDNGDTVPEGTTHELDAIWIRLVDGTALDIGQLSPFSGSTISDWIGYFQKLDNDGWYLHSSKDYIFSHHAFGDDDWLFSMNLEDWIYVNRRWYPLVYSSTNGWYYLIGSAYGELQHGYSYVDKEWILDFWKINP